MSSGSGEKVAGYDDPVDKPRDWDKAVSAAYLRLIGQSQKDAATGAGVGQRSLRRWETCSWWEDARDEARDRWLNDLVAESRATLFRVVQEGDGLRAMQILERMDPKMAPPAQKLQHSGRIEGGVLRVPTPTSEDEWAALADQMKAREGVVGPTGNGSPGGDAAVDGHSD